MEVLAWRKSIVAWTLLLLSVPCAQGGILRANKILLLCHRTANRDLPENTLESLALAARMGCDIVEVDVRSTADGVLVLNHDGLLDRFTDITGDVESTESQELDRMDFGSWMGNRFAGMRIAHFEDALRLAHQLHIGLYLDIKTLGIGPKVLAALRREEMTKHVIFGGEWDDVRHLYPLANNDPNVWLQPGFDRQRVQSLHRRGKIVIANFILNGHEFDVQRMKEAVKFGVDGIMVDYPRLGALAVGRPVEKKIKTLASEANDGPRELRIKAIRELSYFSVLPLQQLFLRWVEDPDDQVSHEAALALVSSRPQPSPSIFESALRSRLAPARANAAWAIGALAGANAQPSQCARVLTPLLQDESTAVLRETLIALGRCQSDPASVSADALLQILRGAVPVLRGLAAVALARHHPNVAAHEVPVQLDTDEAASESLNRAWTARGRPKLTPQEIDVTVELYRSEMKEIRALAGLTGSVPYRSMADQAFRAGKDYSMMPILVAGFSIWDHIRTDPSPALNALNSDDTGEADWAEWALIKAGPEVLPAIRSALPASNGELRRRLIEILTWQADEDAIPVLGSMELGADSGDVSLLPWAISTIGAFHPASADDRRVHQTH